MRDHRKRHINQLRSSHAYNNQPIQFNLKMDILYDSFIVHIPKTEITG